MSAHQQPEPAWPVEVQAWVSESMREGVAIGRDGRIGWASARFAELVGAASADALRGRGLHELLDADGAAAGGDFEARAASGARVLVRTLEGDFGVVWLLDDVSELERYGEEGRALSRRLDAAERELKELRDRLEGERVDRERLLQVVSHELRTPITVIAGYSRLLLAGEVDTLSGQQQHFLAQTAQGCRRLDALMSDLLDASGARGVDGAPRIRPDDLAECVEAAVTFLRPRALERGVSLELALADEARDACFDRSRIGQVLTNLLSNALRYASPGGRVRVATSARLEAGRRQVEVAVEDDGPGIPAERRERIFEPYVRGVGEDDAGGLGLGLAIARRIVEGHGGTIGVSAPDAGGSRFVFAWPADRRQQDWIGPATADPVGEAEEADG